MRTKLFVIYMMLIVSLCSCKDDNKIKTISQELDTIANECSSFNEASEIQNYLTNKQSKIFNNGGYIFVTDKTGVLLLHPNKTLINKNILDIHKLYANFYNEALNNDNKFIKYFFDNRKMILYSKHIKNKDFVLFYYSEL